MISPPSSSASSLANIERNDIFFSRIIGMIPRELYGVNDSESNPADNSKYYKHRKVPLAPDEKKLASKRKLQTAYGSEDCVAEVSEKHNDADVVMDVDDHDLIHTNNSTDSINVGETETPSALDDLRHRLQQRILGLKAQRQPTRPPTDTDTTQQRVRSNKKEGSKKNATAAKENKQQPQQQADVRSSIMGTTTNKDTSDSSSSSSVINSDDVQYSLVVKPTSGNAAAKGLGGKPAAAAAPGSKMKRLQRMLDTAVKKRQRLDDLKSVGAEGAEQLQQELWADAIDSATGAKTGGTDTGKLRKAIKKREKKKQASAAQWKDRLDAVENDKNARLDKREENVAARHKKGGMGRPASLTAASTADVAKPGATNSSGSSSSLSSISDKVKDIKKGRGPWPRPLPPGSSSSSGGGKFAGKGGKAAAAGTSGGRKGAGFEGRFQSSPSPGKTAGFLNGKMGKGKGGGGGGGHKNKK